MKTVPYLIFIAMSLGLLASCSNSDTTKVPSRLTINGADDNGLYLISTASQSQSKTVTFTSSTDWKVYVPSDVDWITVSPSSGSASSEPQTVTVTTTANKMTEQRAAYIDFICDKLQQKSRIQIIQAQLYMIEATTPKIVINKKGGDVVITVDANSDWTYSIDAAGQEWLTESNVQSTSLTLNAKPLEDVSKEKSAVITFTSSADPSVKTTLTIYEKDLDLVINGSKVLAPSAACSGSVSVTPTNVSDWTATASESWIKASKTSLNALSISFDANTTGAGRTGTVTVTATEDESVTMSIPVYQAPAVSATADLLNVEYAADGTAKDVSGNNVDITYVPGAECTIGYNSTYGRYAPSFTHPMNSTGTAGYYYMPLSTEMQTALSDGFTFEVVMKISIDHSGVETKAFSSTSAGGLAVMISSSGVATFLINLSVGGAKSTWRWINGSGTNVTDAVKAPVAVAKDTYYHMIGTWDKKTGMACCYVNGVKVSECSELGEFDIRFAQTSPRFFGIGCNPTVKSGAISGYNGGWYGEVPVVKVFNATLSEDQAMAEYLASTSTPSVIIVP